MRGLGEDDWDGIEEIDEDSKVPIPTIDQFAAQYPLSQRFIVGVDTTSLPETTDGPIYFLDPASGQDVYQDLTLTGPEEVVGGKAYVYYWAERAPEDFRIRRGIVVYFVPDQE